MTGTVSKAAEEERPRVFLGVNRIRTEEEEVLAEKQGRRRVTASEERETGETGLRS